MPKIVVNAFLTLDGVMQAPSGPDEGGFAHGGWQAPHFDDVMERLVTEGITDADGFLLGRKTHDTFANYWPKVTDPNNPIATALNARPKFDEYRLFIVPVVLGSGKRLFGSGTVPMALKQAESITSNKGGT